MNLALHSKYHGKTEIAEAHWRSNVMTFGDSPDHVLSASIGDTLHVLIKQVVNHEVPICIMGGGVVCDAAGWNSQASQHCRV